MNNITITCLWFYNKTLWTIVELIILKVLKFHNYPLFYEQVVWNLYRETVVHIIEFIAILQVDGCFSYWVKSMKNKPVWQENITKSSYHDPMMNSERGCIFHHWDIFIKYIYFIIIYLFNYNVFINMYVLLLKRDVYSFTRPWLINIMFCRIY